MTANQGDLCTFLKSHPNKLYTSRQLALRFKDNKSHIGSKLMKLVRAKFISVHYMGNAIRPYYVYEGKE